ncbi:hypothetical protein PVAND_003539 [Polypedilum vanderplanki]|uniref:ER membrane protein complex subunit 10 n=1 Tax=Polypedilum vanderplanki TaxID=319348 RepID=A0A9J6BUC3_POLVA|nr:hypothetical protein PVAND_003539 [Polypedilum vanderplanki]
MKVTLVYISLIISLIITFVRTQSVAFDSSISIQLFHALDSNNPDSFTSRGNISIVSINSADYQINQKPLKQNELQLFKDLAKNGKFYRLRAEVISTDGIKTSFLTSSKACHLMESQLHDFLTISFDHNNVVVSINLRPVNLETFSDCDDSFLKSVNSNAFNTVVTLKNIDIAPSPDTVGFIQKLEREREQRERGENSKDNRSFLQKYWMYIVPAVILLLISGVSNPEAQGSASGNGNQR